MALAHSWVSQVIGHKHASEDHCRHKGFQKAQMKEVLEPFEDLPLDPPLDPA
jgi:hypothetical protein